MKIYIAYNWVAYEGTNYLKAFSTYEKAKAYCEKNEEERKKLESFEDWEGYDVKEMEVDEA